jgi:hypothetical protein
MVRAAGRLVTTTTRMVRAAARLVTTAMRMA